jgi:hypothetical protein
MLASTVQFSNNNRFHRTRWPRLPAAMASGS